MSFSVQRCAPGVFTLFVDKDVRILQARYQVRVRQFSQFNDLPALVQGVRRCDLTFSWLGKLHAFLAVLFSRLFRMRAIVLAGDDNSKYYSSGNPCGPCVYPPKK